MSYKNLKWNFRVATSLAEHALVPGGQKRSFSIIRVYYKDDKIDSYSHPNQELSDWLSLKEIKQTLKKLKKATKRPILDLDNFPKKYKE